MVVPASLSFPQPLRPPPGNAMAHVNWISVHNQNMNNNTISVTVDLRPSGQVTLNVEVPSELKDALMNLAQKAADAHEAKMHAEIIAKRELEIQAQS
jgi:hypothetical protein